MKRRLRQILTALCLFLCLATIALWVRSAWRCDRAGFKHKTLTADGSAFISRWVGVLSQRGRIQLHANRADYKERDVDKLTQWVTTATAAEIVDDVKGFANGIVRDWREVSAAVRHPYSNGRSEAHVNRLKMIKRKMYGRAKFELLRILATGLATAAFHLLCGKPAFNSLL